MDSRSKFIHAQQEGKFRNADFEINLDGYLFEGKDWNFLKYHMPFRLSGLVEATPITVKEGNFFKSRPEHEKLTSIFIPLWDDNSLPSNVYICWRGKPNKQIKSNNMNKAWQKGYALLPSCLRKIVVDEIGKLSKDSKTRTHHSLNSEVNNMLTVYSETDFVRLGKSFSGEAILKKFEENEQLKNAFFEVNSSEIVFVAYELGINYKVTKENLYVRLRDYFPLVNVKACSHAAFHWAWDYVDSEPMNPEPDSQAFFAPHRIADIMIGKLPRLHKSDFNIYPIGFCRHPSILPNQYQVIGNIQIKETESIKLDGKDNGIRAVNAYKKNGVTALLRNKLLNAEKEGVMPFLDDNVLSRLLKENLFREKKWNEEEKMSAVTGAQRRLVEQNVEDNLIRLGVDHLENDWRINCPCRFELVVKSLKPLQEKSSSNPESDQHETTPVDDIGMIVKSLKAADDWLVRYNLCYPMHCMIQVVNEKDPKLVKHPDCIGLKDVVQRMFSIYKKRVVTLIEHCHILQQQKNMLNGKSAAIQLSAFDFAACYTVECLLIKFYRGNTPANNNGNKVKKWLEEHCESKPKDPAKDAEQITNTICVELDPAVLKLLSILENPSKDDKDNITNLIFEDDNKHWSNNLSVQCFFELKTSWKSLKQTQSDSTWTSFFENFYAFALISHSELYNSKQNASFSRGKVEEGLKERWDRVDGQLAVNARGDGMRCVQFHTLDWLKNIYEKCVCLLPQHSSFFIYDYLKKEADRLLPEDESSKWNEKFEKTGREILNGADVPFVVSMEKKAAYSDLLDLEYEYETTTNSMTGLDLQNTKVGECSEKLEPPTKSQTSNQNKKQKSLTEQMAIIILPTLSREMQHVPHDYVKMCLKSVTFGVNIDKFEEKGKSVTNTFSKVLTSCPGLLKEPFLVVSILHLLRTHLEITLLQSSQLDEGKKATDIKKIKELCEKHDIQGAKEEISVVASLLE